MSKYVRTADHAKSIRNDIKAAQKAGQIDREIKISVTTDSFSGGSAIRVSVKSVPASFPVYDREGLAWREAHPQAQFWDIPREYQERYSPEAQELLSKLTAIVDTYHEDNSTNDGGDTCWNVNFYKTIQIGWECEKLDKVRAKSAAATAQIDPEIVELARRAAANDIAEPAAAVELPAPVKPAKPRIVAYLVEIKPCV